MREECGGPPHGLAGIVQQIIKPRQLLEQAACEVLDTRGVTQIQAMDLQALPELRIVRFEAVAFGGIHRETGGDDDVRAGAQQLQRSLKPDFHARTGDQGIVAGQVRGLLALGVVEIPALPAHGVVIAVGQGEGLFADIAVQGLAQCRRAARGLGGLGFRQPQGRVAGGAALDAQTRVPG